MICAAPTCVLFKPDESFHSFGYEAQSNYREQSDKEYINQWFYFENFKMKSYKEKVGIKHINQKCISWR